MSKDSLRITEIFYSLQGEADTVGWPTVFVRLTGCPLRCQYCDTAYAFTGGKLWQLSDVVAEVASHTAKHVTVSGGEPLAQPNCLRLLTMLCDQGYKVSLETSGAIDISAVDSRVSKVVDIKTPGSKECHRNDFTNLNWITADDQIKFVICDYQDFQWSLEMVDRYQLADQHVLFSPSANQVKPTDLADWILAAKAPVRFQLQLHKLLWGDVAGK